MTIGAGIGMANFTFDDADGFWRWVDLCDNGGVDSIWQSDRIIERSPNLETMSVMAALCLLYTSPSPRDSNLSRMPSSA